MVLVGSLAAKTEAQLKAFTLQKAPDARSLNMLLVGVHACRFYAV